MVKTRRERKREEELEELERGMASTPLAPPFPMATLDDGSLKPIPLVCSVCPSVPSFSDSSHLLTHIASKGHLHHETQTKLRAHRDLDAMLALQQYELWYKENNIETLLVERLKAKQDKEAARVKRGRGTPSVASTRQARKKPSRSTSASTIIKAEQDDFASAFPAMFPQFGPSDQDSELMDDLVPFGDLTSGEAMSLKGQVYPGMGKMDLANEEMRRTRNQRKPKSVVDRMRRTSEGIESTQVVMTSDFEIERVKDVYDDESPIEDDEDQSPPRKVTRTRRKKARPLADLPTNVPRSLTRSISREDSTCSGPSSKPNMRSNHMMGAVVTPMAPLKQSFDVFRDEDTKPAFEAPMLAPQLKREPRFGDHFALHALNSFSHSNMSSPSPSMRDMTSRNGLSQDTAQSRLQAYPYYNHDPLAFNSFQRNDDYNVNGSLWYSNAPRLPYTAYGGPTHDPYRVPHAAPAIKTDQFPAVTPGDALGSNEHNLFLNFPSASPNPLLGQERGFLHTYQQVSAQQPESPLDYTPADRSRDSPYSGGHGHDFAQATPSHIKVEPLSHHTIASDGSTDGKEQLFEEKIMWPENGSEDDLPLHDDLSRTSAA